MLTPTPADLHAAQIFGRECESALTDSAECDALRSFESIHRVLDTCPDCLSAICMSQVAMSVVLLGQQMLRRRRVVGIECTPVCQSTRDRVCQALERVFAWHAQPSLTLNQIALSLGVGPRYLSEHLNDLSARTFLTHLHVIRVIHAADELAHTSDSIETIARAVGYLCAPQLNKHFRRILHTTPSRFRVVLSAAEDLQTRIGLKRSFS